MKPNTKTFRLAQRLCLFICCFSYGIIRLDTKKQCHAQGPNPTIGLSSPSASLNAMELASLPITLSVLAPAADIPRAVFSIHCNSTELSFVSANPGPALLAYGQTYNEEVDCDIVVYPHQVDVIIYFDSVYFSPMEFSGHFIELQVAALSSSPLMSTISFYEPNSVPIGTTEIQVLEAIEIYRGDVNLDGNRNLSDAIALLAILFNGTISQCEDAADLNDDGLVQIPDAIMLLQGLFTNQSQLPASCQIDSVLDNFEPCAASCP